VPTVYKAATFTPIRHNEYATHMTAHSTAFAVTQRSTRSSRKPNLACMLRSASAQAGRLCCCQLSHQSCNEATSSSAWGTLTAVFFKRKTSVPKPTSARKMAETSIAAQAKKNVVNNNSIFRETLKKERKAFRLRLRHASAHKLTVLFTSCQNLRRNEK